MTIYKVQAPNGRILEIEGPEGATDEQLIQVATQHFSGAPKRSSDAATQIRGDAITQAAMDPAGDMGGGGRFLAGMGKAFTDVGQGAAQMVGLGPTRKEVDERRDRDVSLMATPGGYMGSMAGGMAAAAPAAIMGPTLGAAAASGGLYGMLQPVGQEDSRLANTAIGAATGGAMKYGTDKLAGALSTAVQNARANAAPANARASELAAVLQQGREAGLSVPPTQANPSILNRVMESIGGKAAMQQQASANNQNAVYGAAQRHAGLQPSQPLNEATLDAARDAVAAPYKQIAAQSPQAKQLLEAWKAANFEARMQRGYFEKSGNPEAYKAADAAKQAADNALTQIEQMVGPQARQALQESRQQIAKIHTVEDIVRGSSVDPAALVRAVNSGVPVSGELARMARFAQDFPKAMQAPQVGGSVGVNQLMPWLGGGAGGVLGGLVGGPTGGGAGAMAGAAATQAVPPMVRALMLSRPYQAAMTSPPTAGPSNLSVLANAILQNPEMRALLPAAGAAYATGQ